MRTSSEAGISAVAVGPSDCQAFNGVGGGSDDGTPENGESGSGWWRWWMKDESGRYVVYDEAFPSVDPC